MRSSQAAWEDKTFASTADSSLAKANCVAHRRPQTRKPKSVATARRPSQRLGSDGSYCRAVAREDDGDREASEGRGLIEPLIGSFWRRGFADLREVGAGRAWETVLWLHRRCTAAVPSAALLSLWDRWMMRPLLWVGGPQLLALVFSSMQYAARGRILSWPL